MKIIAHIHTDFPDKFGIPRQSGLVKELKGEIIFEPEYRNPEAVRGLERFSHIWLLWQFSENRKEHWSATVKPPRLGGKKRVGVFASRSPYRPNGIGLSCVRLESIRTDEKQGTVLCVSGADLMDGTPVYDIKPYIPMSDCRPEATEGYTEETRLHRLKVDFPDELLGIYPEEKRSAILGVLAEDPRPAYVQDEERVYGLRFAGYDVKFRVVEDVVRVCGVERLLQKGGRSMLVSKKDIVGITKDRKNSGEIDIKGGQNVVRVIREFAKYGLITFSKDLYFKSTYYTIHFFKPVETLRNLYNLGNEVLIVCSTDSMRDFKSRTKDFLDYLLITSQEYKNRLDKITCFLVDENEDIISIVKDDRMENPDTRLIVPFCYDELKNGLDEDHLKNRMRDFLYERDLFGIASPLNSESLFFGKDRTNIISELYGKYKQGEQGGLFGLRRIGKTSVLNLLRLRIQRENGVAVYFDCSQYHRYRWNELLKQINDRIISQYKHAMKSFEIDIKKIYEILENKRILLIFDEIESISYTTSPSEHWKKENDSLFFWQALRAIIQTDNSFFSFLIAGVNPKMVEIGRINEYDNPIFGIFRPIYMELFDFDDVKTMIGDIGAHLGVRFEEQVVSKLLEDYGGHPFLTRQVCSKMNRELMLNRVERPAMISRYAYLKKSDEYKLEMVGVIEQILGVLKMYYPEEFELLKKLALDGRKSFAKELSHGEKEIQHLRGYCLIEKDDGEYFIRIKSIEEYLNAKFEYEKDITDQSEKRTRLNRRREKLENRLREIIFFNMQLKYGKKAKEKLVLHLKGTTTDKTQEGKIAEASLKKAMEELYFSQLKALILKDWKDYQNLFNDRVRFEQFFDLVNQSRGAGDHGRSLSDEDEALYNIAFRFFDGCLADY